MNIQTKEQAIAEAQRISKISKTWSELAEILNSCIEDNFELLSKNPENLKQVKESKRIAEAEAMFEADRAVAFVQDWNFNNRENMI